MPARDARPTAPPPVGSAAPTGRRSTRGARTSRRAYTRYSAQAGSRYGGRFRRRVTSHRRDSGAVAHGKGGTGQCATAWKKAGLIGLGTVLGRAAVASTSRRSRSARRRLPIPYEDLQLLSAVFGKIKSDYVEPVSDDKLIKEAINGMVRGLDPHSDFLDADAFKELQVSHAGQVRRTRHRGRRRGRRRARRSRRSRTRRRSAPASSPAT